LIHTHIYQFIPLEYIHLFWFPKSTWVPPVPIIRGTANTIRPGAPKLRHPEVRDAHATLGCAVGCTQVGQDLKKIKKNGGLMENRHGFVFPFS